MQHDDSLLLHILIASRKIKRHTDGKTLEQFLADSFSKIL
jgi:hypothetical protein